MLKSSGPRMDTWGAPLMIFRKVLLQCPNFTICSHLRGYFAAGNVLSQKDHRLPAYQRQGHEGDSQRPLAKLLLSNSLFQSSKSLSSVV